MASALFLLSVALPLATVACKSKKPDASSAPTDPDQQYPGPNPSGGIIMSAITGCDDIPTCERECDAGASDRCRRLAVSYSFGQGVDKNETTATALFVKACDQGNASACVSAGQMYEFHHGVDKDDARAAGYYRASCDLGWGAGCVNYGIMLENGRGVPQDKASAKALYDSACKQGAQVACKRRDDVDLGQK
jgi:TPR repeat protein